MTPISTSEDRVNVKFVGKALPLFGRVIVVTLLSLLIIPAPWINTWLYKWVVARLQLSDGTRGSFEGRGGEMWFPFMAYMLLGLVSQSQLVLQEVPFMPVFVIPINCIFFLMIFRWLVRSVNLSCGTSLTFTGGYWPYLGWSLLFVISIFTIIGWAWTAAAIHRWFCRNVHGGEHRVEFTGNGWNILWRSLVTGLSCLLIVPMPWTTLWLVKWLVENISIKKMPLGTV